MDWAAVEEIVYAEAEHPEDILGSHNAGRNSMVQAFFPGAKAVTLLTTEEKFTTGKRVKVEIEMDEMDEAGFFAALLPGKNRHDYSYRVTFEDKTIETMELYGNIHALTEAEAEELNGGSCYDAYKKVGAHIKTVDGIKGCAFSVWAPNALRVSVVGDFNNWNGSCYQMMRVGATGFFELFVPGIEVGARYKFELLVNGNKRKSKADPYAISFDGKSGASIVTDVKNYKWTDADFIADRNSNSWTNRPLNIYEVSLGCIEGETLKDKAKALISHVKNMGYTHIELMPIAEYEDDNCNGYDTTGYYAPTHRFGEVNDYKAFVNELHNEGIGVIMQWTANAFSKDNNGLGVFDGTCLFEHEDYRKGVDARTGQLLFNYLRPEVKEYLIGNAIYWANEFHFDGIKLVDVTSMLYLDYYRNAGEWIPNIYGGNENLDSITFIKKVNKHVHKKCKGVITIADERSGFPNMTAMEGMNTGDLEDCLGFDLTMNGGFNSDVLDYMSNDPINRSGLHPIITGTMLYSYRENYVLPITHNDIDFGKGGIITRMFGDDAAKYANLRAFYAYMMLHPGKKEIFMGQELAISNSFEGNDSFALGVSDNKEQKDFLSYMRSLNLLYLNNSALYELDYKEKGFEWINNMSANENVISFMRKDSKGKFLYIVINFANCVYDKYKLGVPFKGKYKEIFNSDELAYGGAGNTNARMIPSKLDECDGREESIRITIAPLAVSVFEYTPYTDAELLEIKKREEEREKKRIEKEKARIKAAEERAKQREKLAKEKAKIRASLKEELERKIKEAEEKIAGGSENKAAGKSVKKKKNVKKK